MDYNEGNTKKMLNVKAIDVPGQGHFRHQIQARFGEVLAVVLVLDSTTRQTDAQASELLYDVLNSSIMRQNEVPVLIACNKQDMSDARKANQIEKDIEVQMYDHYYI